MAALHAFISAFIVAILSLLPGQSAAVQPQAQTAAAVETQTTQQLPADPFDPPATSSPPASSTSEEATTTPIIEKIVEEEPLASDDLSGDYVTQDELNAQLNDLSNSLLAKFGAQSPSQSTSSIPEYVAADGNPANPYAAASAINNLSNVTLTSPSITGLSTDDVPDLSGQYLSLNGGTVTGHSAFGDTASIDMDDIFGEPMSTALSVSWTATSTEPNDDFGNNGIYSNLVFDPSSDPSGNVNSEWGLYSQVSTKEGNPFNLSSTDLSGGYFSASNNASSSPAQLAGIQGIAENQNTDAQGQFIYGVVGDVLDEADNGQDSGSYFQAYDTGNGGYITGSASYGGGSGNGDNTDGTYTEAAQDGGSGGYLAGLDAWAYADEGAAVSGAYGIDTGVYEGDNTATIDDAFGVYIDNTDTHGSTIGNNYGLYVNDESNVATSTNFNIYSDGAGTNYFGGDTGIGTSSPNLLLTVGSSNVSGAVADFINSTGSCTINPTTTSLSCSSDQRLKDNINSIGTSTALADLMQLDPVFYNWISEATGTPQHAGFIAQAVQPIFPDLVSTDANGYFQLNYAGFVPYIVAAVQNLANEVAGFADEFTTKQLTFDRASGQELCLQKSDGTSECITGDQLAAVLAAENVSPDDVSSADVIPDDSDAADTSDSDATDTPPVISINGNNPAIIQVGTVYTDLGAQITGPQQDLNLGIQTFVNGGPMNPVLIDTSAVATDTIDYVVTDQNGLTSTSTRTVIVQAPSDYPFVQDASDDNSSTSTSAANDNANSTDGSATSSSPASSPPAATSTQAS